MKLLTRSRKKLLRKDEDAVMVKAEVVLREAEVVVEVRCFFPNITKSALCLIFCLRGFWCSISDNQMLLL